MQKIALNPFDDKRYIIKPDGIDTLAWGHYKLDLEKMEREYQYVADVTQRMRILIKGRNHETTLHEASSASFLPLQFMK